MERFALPVPPIRTEEASANPFAWALRAVATFHHRNLPAPVILDALTGGPFTFVASAGACTHWWIGAGKARHPRDLGTFLGWELRSLACDGTAVGYEEELKPFVACELTYGRPVLAYAGWPGRARHHWGIITALGEGHRPIGVAPWNTPLAPEETGVGAGVESQMAGCAYCVEMEGWPHKIVIAKPRHLTPVPVAEAYRHAVRHAVQVWDDPVASETANRPTEGVWHSGAAAFALLQQRWESPGVFCPHCNEQTCFAAFVESRAQNLANAAAFLREASQVCSEPRWEDIATGYHHLAADWGAIDIPSAAANRHALSDRVRAWADAEEDLAHQLGLSLQPSEALVQG